MDISVNISYIYIYILFFSFFLPLLFSLGPPKDILTKSLDSFTDIHGLFMGILHGSPFLLLGYPWITKREGGEVGGTFFQIFQ